MSAPGPVQVLTALAGAGYCVTLSGQAGVWSIAAIKLDTERLYAPPTAPTLEQAVGALAAGIVRDEPQGRFARWFDPAAAGLKPTLPLRVEGDERKGALPGGAAPTI